jgi:hypothetical protein
MAALAALMVSCARARGSWTIAAHHRSGERVRPCMTPSEDRIESLNNAIVKASFETWASGAVSPYDLLADDASWSIVGHSVASKTYPSKEAFLLEVIRPFNARMSGAYRPQYLRRGRNRHRLLRRQRHGWRRQALCQHLCLVPQSGEQQGNEGVGLLRQHRIQRLLAAGTT